MTVHFHHCRGCFCDLPCMYSRAIYAARMDNEIDQLQNHLVQALKDPAVDRPRGIKEVSGCYAVSASAVATLLSIPRKKAEGLLRYHLVPHPGEWERTRDGTILYRLPIPYKTRAEVLADWLQAKPERLPFQHVPSGKVIRGGDVARATGHSPSMCGQALAVIAKRCKGVHRAAYWDPTEQQSVRGWRFPNDQ